MAPAPDDPLPPHGAGSEPPASATSARRWRLPHWGWLLAGGTLFLTAFVVGGFAWSQRRADALLRSIRAEGVELTLHTRERPVWMQEWMNEAGFQREFVPGFDRILGFTVKKGNSERVFPLFDYAPELEFLYPGEISADGIERLATLTTLRTVSFSGSSSVTNESLLPLARLSELRRVSIHSGQVDDRGLACLAALPHFRGLSLFGEGQELSGEGLAHFGREARLTDLILRDVRLTDVAGRELPKLRELRRLVLQRVDVPTKAITELHSHSRLDSLCLVGRPIDDEAFDRTQAGSWPPTLMLRSADLGVQLLSRSRRVEELGLGQTRITDAAAEHLATMTRLKKLYLSDLRVPSPLPLRSKRLISSRPERILRTGEKPKALNAKTPGARRNAKREINAGKYQPWIDAFPASRFWCSFAILCGLRVFALKLPFSSLLLLLLVAAQPRCVSISVAPYRSTVERGAPDVPNERRMQHLHGGRRV